MKIFFILSGLIIFSARAQVPPVLLTEALHRCDDGPGGATASAVSRNVAGALPGQRFRNVVNRTLACCVNTATDNRELNSDTNSPGSPGFEKFDCKERNYQNADFDTVWSQTNEGSANGVPNAVMLRNSGGELVTGFFTSDLQRCNQYSEFTRNEIQPGVLTGPNFGTFQAEGAVITKPSGDAWNNIVGSVNKNAPNCSQNPTECKRCNILVRAVALASCPASPAKTAVTGAGPTEVKHCVVADSVQIRIQVRQIYRIGGKPVFKTLDTTLDSRAASSISISDLYR